MIFSSFYSDEELLDLLKSDDNNAFRELYERYWKKLLVRANILLDSNEDAEELVHDIFVKLWKKRNTIALRHTFHTYVAAMLQYACFEVLANRKRNVSVKNIEMTGFADTSTQEYLDFDSLRNQLEDAVKQLPDKCQLIFRLSREEGLSDKAIAEKLHISVNTVRTQIARALRKLKASLNSFFIL